MLTDEVDDYAKNGFGSAIRQVRRSCFDEQSSSSRSTPAVLI
jgi:hypothetical protein